MSPSCMTNSLLKLLLFPKIIKLENLKFEKIQLRTSIPARLRSAMFLRR